MALVELGRWPLHVHWVQQVARFWNRMLEMQGSSRLISLAFQDNLALMQEQLALKARTGRSVASPCWCLRWMRALSSVAPTHAGTLIGVTELDEEALVARAQNQFIRAAAAAQPRGCGQEAATDPAVSAAQTTPSRNTAAMEGDGSAPPRKEGEQGADLHGSASCDGCACQPAGSAHERRPQAVNKFAHYIQCVRGDTPIGTPPEYLVQGLVRDARHRACLSRFRCSCHELRVERDRYLPVAAKPPRHMRTCLICASPAVEDEHHLVFDCPLYDSLRFQFADLFSTDCHTVACFLSKNPDRVARFIYSCFELRRSTTHMSLAGSEIALSL